GRLGLGRLKLGGDQRVVFGAEVNLIVKVGKRSGGLCLAAGFQPLLTLKRLDLLDGDLELMGDPGVRASLTHPRADSVQFGSQRSTCHKLRRLVQETVGPSARGGEALV